MKLRLLLPILLWFVSAPALADLETGPFDPIDPPHHEVEQEAGHRLKILSEWDVQTIEAVTSLAQEEAELEAEIENLTVTDQEIHLDLPEKVQEAVTCLDEVRVDLISATESGMDVLAEELGTALLECAASL